MIRAPVSAIQDLQEDDGQKLISNNAKSRKHHSSNSLGQSDFANGSEEPGDGNDDVFNFDVENENQADDEIEESLDYEEQKRRRSFERKVHRQTQRRGSVEDYEQSDDVQFVQRIQSYNSLTGKEIARLQGSSPIPIKLKRQAPPVPGKNPSQPLPKSTSSGHQRKNTLDMWKEKAAEMKNAPAFPPHQTTISSHPYSQTKSKKIAKFQRLSEEAEDDVSEDYDEISHSANRQSAEPARHERSPTLQEWKSRAEQTEIKASAPPAEQNQDFGTIEDQCWATNVKCGDTLKRFKQKQPRSIASNDFFAAPSSTVAEELIVEEPENNALSYSADSQSDTSSYQPSDDGTGQDPQMRELIRDCLRVIGSMSRSGLINQTQKLALKGLAFRKDKRIVDIAKRFRQSKSNAQQSDDRELVMHDLELAFARLVCNLD